MENLYCLRWKCRFFPPEKPFSPVFRHSFFIL